MPSISCDAVHLSSISLPPPPPPVPSSPTLFHHASLDDDPSCTRTADDMPGQLLLLTKDPFPVHILRLFRAPCMQPSCIPMPYLYLPQSTSIHPWKARSQRAPAAILPRTPASSQPARCRRDLAFQGQCQDDCTSRRAGSGKGFNHNVSIRLVCCLALPRTPATLSLVNAAGITSSTVR